MPWWKWDGSGHCNVEAHGAGYLMTKLVAGNSSTLDTPLSTFTVPKPISEPTNALSIQVKCVDDQLPRFLHSDDI